MHYAVAVLLDPGTPRDEIDQALKRALAPFDEALEVEPYRVHESDQNRQMMAQAYGLDPDDLEALASRMPRWRNRPGGVDEEGLYYVTTKNPDSWWDWYVIGGRWDGVYTGTPGVNISRVRDLPPAERVEEPGEEPYYGVPHAILTPGGEWNARDEAGWIGYGPNAISRAEWSKRYFEILSAHPDCWIVFVDCHI